jgi:hypothetical protein
VFNRALPLAEQSGQSALAAEAPDDPLGGVRALFHGSHSNEFFVILQGRARTGHDDKRLCGHAMVLGEGMYFETD